MRDRSFAAYDQVIPFSMNGLIRDAAEIFTERMARQSISTHLALGPDLPVAEGCANQLQRVVAGLIQNAMEAMRLGGELNLVTRYNQEQSAIEVDISDTGAGIPAENLAHLFEPGFSTKSAEQYGSGFGWGLFFAREVIHAHGGDIQIHSPCVQGISGTTVHLRLPVPRRQ